MQSPLTTKKGRALLNDIKSLFFNKNVYVEPGHKLIFVCGGPVKPRLRNGRATFLRYSKTNLPQYRFVEAEAAGRDIRQYSDAPVFLELNDFETLIASVADCVLLFSESPGSIAELGFFSGIREIRSRMLVVCKNDHQLRSFISDGPLRAIDRDSAFGRTIFLNHFDLSHFDRYLKCLLEDTLSFRRAHEIDVRDHGLIPKNLFYLLYELIRIFRTLNLDRIFDILNQFYSEEKVSSDHVRHLMALLVASNLVRRSQSYKSYFVVCDPKHQILRIDGANIQDWIIRVTEFYYKQKDRVALRVIKESGDAA